MGTRLRAGHKGAHKRGKSALVRQLVGAMGHKGTHEHETGALVCELVATRPRPSGRQARMCMSQCGHTGSQARPQA